MINSKMLIEKINSGEFDERLADVYFDEPAQLDYQRKRYTEAIARYHETFGEGEVEVYSAPGRTEVGGNHTDHQQGMVLAASVNLDAIAIVSNGSDNQIKILSEGYSLTTVDLTDLELKEEEKETTTALIKGVAARMKSLGYQVEAFNAYITSDVLIGAGLSSSAAFEAIIGTIISGIFNDMGVSPVEIAQIGQYAENVYFGKPCGLMDQMACSVGGFVHIDFLNPQKPVVNKIEFNIAEQGYSLCIVDTKGSHADLTADYAAIPEEMKAVAAYLGGSVLTDVKEEEFYSCIPEIREKLGDRAVLRAFHFFNENKRVHKEADALLHNDFETFLGVFRESAASSYKYLQNAYANHDVRNQAVPVTLALSEEFLGENGVCRIHGGGFAGTVQIFVKNHFVAEYKEKIEKVLGEGACHILRIRKYGGVKVL